MNFGAIVTDGANHGVGVVIRDDVGKLLVAVCVRLKPDGQLM